MSPSLQLVVGSATDTGLVRDHNEDGFLVDDGSGLFAVADGMGGHRGGEVASAVALATLQAEFEAGLELEESVVRANDAVYERSTADDAVRGMGTTLTAAYLDGDGRTFVVGHVGDSRAYLLRDGELHRITTDHSLVEELMAAGELTEEEAEVDPRRSMITRALGLEEGVNVDLYTVELEPGDRLLLCSDGLNTMVREPEVATLLSAAATPDEVARNLVAAANAAGGVDNTTVVVLDVVEPSESPDDEGDGEGDLEAAGETPGQSPDESPDESPAESSGGRRRWFRRRR